MAQVNERVHFRLLVCPQCKHQMCWVNPRLPMYCPQCGKPIYPAIRSEVVFSDEHATLRYNGDAYFIATEALRTDPEAAP